MTAIVFARRALFHAVGLALLCGPASVFQARAQAAGSTTPIERLYQGLLTVMKQGKTTSFSQRAAELTPAVENAFDLPIVLRASIGPAWVNLTPDEQRRLLNIFRQYTVATYVEGFNSYDGQRLVVSPQTRSLSNGGQVVHTEVIPPRGEKHTIDYVMRRMPDGSWKATDVLADGTISRVAVQRSDFGALLARGGAAALEASLQRKTAALERS
jgi:phospholipid transport system substrate-binding protein